MTHRVTFKTNKGPFTVDIEGYFGFKVGQRCFTQSPFYKKRGTYEILKIEIIER